MENRKTMRMELQTAYLAEHLKEDEKIELLYQSLKEIKIFDGEE